MLSSCHLPMSYPAYSDLLGAIPDPLPPTPAYSMFHVRRSMFKFHITPAPLLATFTTFHVASESNPKPYLPASLCQVMPATPPPGFSACLYSREPLSIDVKLCQAPPPPTPAYSMFHVRRSMFKFHPPHPALQSSWVKPGQAQSSSLAGKKDCLFIAVSVASVSSC